VRGTDNALQQDPAHKGVAASTHQSHLEPQTHFKILILRSHSDSADSHGLASGNAIISRMLTSRHLKICLHRHWNGRRRPASCFSSLSRRYVEAHQALRLVHLPLPSMLHSHSPAGPRASTAGRRCSTTACIAAVLPLSPYPRPTLPLVVADVEMHLQVTGHHRAATAKTRFQVREPLIHVRRTSSSFSGPGHVFAIC
jgi:hypothetical protein